MKISAGLQECEPSPSALESHPSQIDPIPGAIPRQACLSGSTLEVVWLAGSLLSRVEIQELPSCVEAEQGSSFQHFKDFPNIFRKSAQCHHFASGRNHLPEMKRIMCTLNLHSFDSLNSSRIVTGCRTSCSVWMRILASMLTAAWYHSPHISRPVY